MPQDQLLRADAWQLLFELKRQCLSFFNLSPRSPRYASPGVFRQCRHLVGDDLSTV